MRGKPSVDRIKLIQSVMSDQINPTSADDAAAFMHEIAAIAFDGYFAGGGAYLNFGVGSWLDGKLTVLLLRAGKLSQSSFVKVLIGVGCVFRGKSAGDSDRNRPPITIQVGHLIR